MRKQQAPPVAALIRNAERYWTKLPALWKATRQGRENGTHDLRVLGRRIAASLEIFNALDDRPATRRLRRQIREMVRRLGHLRDIQVLRLVIRGMRPNAALKAFLVHLDELEQKELAAVGDWLDESLRRKWTERWQEISRTLRQQAGGLAAPQCRKVVLKLLHVRSQRFETALAALRLTDFESLHNARIAYKRLRYIREGACGIVSTLSEAKDEIGRYQRTFGEILDAEMTRKHLLQWAAGRNARERRQVGIVCRRLEQQVRIIVASIASGSLSGVPGESNATASGAPAFPR